VRRQLPAVRLINLYGTSECSADVLCFECLAGSPGSSGSSGSLAQPPAYGRHDGRRDERSTGGLVPLGHPISGARVRLLAPQQEQGFEDEVPEGELGEVWVGGEVVALGYLGQPQLTAAHFRRSRSIRWFRTGDLGRREARTGMVHFHGRADAQLQLRGYRVESLEVEAVFTRMPGVLQAVVVPLRAPAVFTPQAAAFPFEIRAPAAPAQAAAFPFESALGPDEPPGSAVAGVEFGPPGSAVALMLLCTLAHEGTISGAVLGAPDEGCNHRSSEVISAHYEGTISGAVLGAPDEGCNQRSSEVISAHYEGTISGGGAALEGGTGSVALSTALLDDGRAPVDLCGLRVRPAASSRAMHSAFEAWGLAQLPSWMIPSSFVILDTLPRLG
jgi:acyl-CoA synthetase (AMP-forming)/AMP-acid ligase II